MTPTLQTAQLLHASGVSCIPCAADKLAADAAVCHMSAPKFTGETPKHLIGEGITPKHIREASNLPSSAPASDQPGRVVVDTTMPAEPTPFCSFAGAPQPTPPSLSALAAREIVAWSHGNIHPDYTEELAIRIARVVEAPLLAERDEWKEKYTTLDKELMCELRDPCGTIWEHARGWARVVAKEYGVNHATISYIINGKSWTHVK